MKLDFEVQTDYGMYRDALYLPDDGTFTPEDIEKIKQERVDNWIAAITSASEEPTEEQ